MKKFITLVLAAILLLQTIPVFAEERTGFTVDNQYLLDISKPISVNLKTSESFEKATFFLDGGIISEISDDGSRERNVELDLSQSPYLGEAELSVRVEYETVDEVKIPVFLTKLGEVSDPVFYEDFSEATTDTPNPSLNYNTNIEANNAKVSLAHYEYGEGDKALEIAMNSSISSKEPFLLKDGLAVADGSNITILFDIYFTTNRAYVKLETRDLSPGKYPTDAGASMPTLSIFKGRTTIAGNEYAAECWYTCKVEINTVYKGLKFYLKKEGEDEFTLEHSMPEYNSVGFNQIRFCAGSLDSSGGSVILDNISVTYQREDGMWYAKPSYKSAEGATVTNRNVAVKDGVIDLVFSKKMKGVSTETIKIFNAAGDEIEYDGTYDSETAIYTMKPKGELLYDRDYTIKLFESINSVDESPRLSQSEINFKTEKYPVSIISCKSVADGIEVLLDGEENVNGEILVVYIMSDGMLYSANMTQLTSLGAEYRLTLSKPSGEFKTYAYIMKSLTDFTIKEAYND